MPDPFPETITLKWRDKTEWENWHHTIREPIEGIYELHYPPDNPQTTPAVLNSCTQDIQLAIKTAKARGLTLRAAGSAWSLSTAGIADSGIMLDTSRLKGRVKLNDGNIDPAYPGDDSDRRGLFLFQCGNLIAEINKLLESDAHRRAMRTTGAANGQTIVGASATGTHGSVIGRGAIHDQIVGLHLIVNEHRHVWLERVSRPVVKPAFAALLGAELIRSEALFNAAVMSFGSFGVIHNVLLETRPRFLLDAETYAPVAFDQDLRDLIATLDPSTHPKLKGKGDPYFLQIVVNPHSADAMINVMYERGWRTSHIPDYRMKAGKIGPGYDSLSVVGKIFEANKQIIPPFFKLMEMFIDKKPRTGSWGELFGYKAPQTKVGSGTVAVAHEDALKTIDLLIDLNKEIGPVPLVFGLRFVDRSDALLAFNRFDRTMVVSMDGIANGQAETFFRVSAERMEQAGIRYTQHWGKTNAYTPDRIRAAYGHGRVDSWIAARHQLMPDPADRAVFDNVYIRERGLAG